VSVPIYFLVVVYNVDMIVVCQECERDARLALQGLEEDKEIMRRLQEVKHKRKHSDKNIDNGKCGRGTPTRTSTTVSVGEVPQEHRQRLVWERYSDKNIDNGKCGRGTLTRTSTTVSVGEVLRQEHRQR